MSYQLGNRSRANMVGLHPHGIEILEKGIITSKIDFTVLSSTVRTQAQQDEMYAQGRTKPGKKITWTRNSRHIKKVSLRYPQFGPVSHAWDVAPWPINWNDTDRFLRLQIHLLGVAIELGYKVRLGYDWDGDGVYRETGETDGPHMELAISDYPT